MTPKLHKIKAGVPQSSVLGPTLYILYAVDLLVTEGALSGTIADDMVVFATHDDPAIASKNIQNIFDEIDR